MSSFFHVDEIDIPGRRMRTSICQELPGFFGLFVTYGCKASVVLTSATSLCIPEIALYMVM